MRSTVLRFLLLAFAIAGFASGAYGCRHDGERRHAFEDHIADVCTRAAERTHGHPPHAENMP